MRETPRQAEGLRPHRFPPAAERVMTAVGAAAASVCARAAPTPDALQMTSLQPLKEALSLFPFYRRGN